MLPVRKLRVPYPRLRMSIILVSSQMEDFCLRVQLLKHFQARLDIRLTSLTGQCRALSMQLAQLNQGLRAM
jgi:hypothetical protein